ncbi:MAG: thiolase family protein [Sporichthyaceae bacterium]
MRFTDVAIPAGLAWSSPFAKWQGSLAGVNSLDLAAAVTTKALGERHVAVENIDGLVLGWTIPQTEAFYGAPSLAVKIGAPGLTGPMVAQACATGVAVLAAAAGQVAAGAGTQLVVTTDRTSNGPLLSYPNPTGMGGAPKTEHWVLDSFGRDPSTGKGMLVAGETVAAKHGITRGECDDLTVLRSEQYQRSLADDRAFQRRYQVAVVIPTKRGRGLVLEADEGIRPAVLEEISKLAPVDPNGVLTFASQTHPADGTAGAIVTTADRARELSGGNGIVRLLGVGYARVGTCHMPEAPVPAAQRALEAAGLTLADVDAVTTHNPFAVNDLVFARETGFPLERMNAYGSSLIFGHPQAPTGLRSIAELIEELRLRGGGVGLFTGCAAGDTGAAIVLRVED